jgi:hypothetical protein
MSSCWVDAAARRLLTQTPARDPLPGVEQHQAVAVLDHIRIDSITYALIGRGPVQRREASSHQKVGRQVDARWSGRICTWPVLTTDTRRTGSLTSMSGPFDIQRNGSLACRQGLVRAAATCGSALPTARLRAQVGPGRKGRAAHQSITGLLRRLASW